jgi:hypothetical protein
MKNINYKAIEENITKLRQLVLGDVNVNTIKQTIKCIDDIKFSFLKLKVDKALYKRYFTDSCILSDVTKEIKENKLIRKNKLESISNSWIDFQYNKGENNAK